MILLSCANCSYNGLQYGAIGLTVGYCAEHRKLLRRADETTCARMLRKDLGSESREREHSFHRDRYSHKIIQFVASGEPAPEPMVVDDDSSVLEGDTVGDAVADYGMLGTKIASLAQLRQIPGVRAELAMLTLGRAYVRRCAIRKGQWTSGFSLFWWTRRRLTTLPALAITDFRQQTSASVHRQFDLAAWSILMLRLNLISDVGMLAPKSDPMSALAELVEQAAEATETPDLGALHEWLLTAGDAAVTLAMPVSRYREFRAQFQKEPDDDETEEDGSDSGSGGIAPTGDGS
jgi:hypothetical protein